METPLKKAVVASQQTLWQTGMHWILTYLEDVAVCGWARSGPETRQLAGEHLPSLLVIDSSLPGGALGVTRDIRQISPATRVLIVGSPEDRLFFKKALAAGACGVVELTASNDEIALAAGMVLKGYTYLTHSQKEALAAGEKETKKLTRQLDLGPLTEREKEIFEALGRGVIIRNIADNVGISVKTVESHVHRIKRKLQLNSLEALRMTAEKWWRKQQSGQRTDQ